MFSHDIIDNRNEKLADHINTILLGTEKARFAVGYFFLSGFEAIKDRLKDIKELRLLIGYTTSITCGIKLTAGDMGIRETVAPKIICSEALP